MTRTQNATSARAMRLAMAMTRLRARLRREQSSVATGWTVSQLSVLGRIAEAGPMTASALAQAEHVRAQSIAETVGALKRGGLVEGRPDPSDGRKTLLAVTVRGRRLVESIVDLRGAWLARAIEQHVTQVEQEVLAQAAEIMTRLADCQLEPSPDEGWRV